MNQAKPVVKADVDTGVVSRDEAPVVPSATSNDPALTADASQTARRPSQRRAVLLRLNPTVHDALAHWAADDLRSLNAQIEYLLREALKSSARLPGDVGPLPKRGRPPNPVAGSAPAEPAPTD